MVALAPGSIRMVVSGCSKIAGPLTVAPAGMALIPGDAAAWASDRAGHVFSLALSLAAPFAAASFVYNLALGAINRAMPQLMVAFVGAPAITAGALLILWAAAPEILARWGEAADLALIDPFGAR